MRTSGRDATIKSRSCSAFVLFSEEHLTHLFHANYAGEFMHYAVVKDEHDQNDLNGPEVRPHHFRQ